MRFLLAIILLISREALSQELLLNGSFEDENICLEYQKNCAPEAWVYTGASFNYYFKEKKLAHSGSHCLGLIAGHSIRSYFRTFARSPLLCGLRKGKQYEIRFYIRSVHPVLDSMGIYFSSGDFLFIRGSYRNLRPSVYFVNAIKPPMPDTNWQEVVIHYTAAGGEAYMAIGNFSRLDITGPTHIDRENNFFVLLDDVSIKPLDPSELLCPGWQQRQEDIYAEDERHEYLDRLIRQNRNSPQTDTLPTTLISRIDTVTLPDLLFATNSASPGKEAVLLLDSLVAGYNGNPPDSIVITGHTDSTGSVEANKLLSLQRAGKVADHLRKLLPATLLIIRGKGSSEPLAGNDTPAGRQLNRRVAIYFYRKD